MEKIRIQKADSAAEVRNLYMSWVSRGYKILEIRNGQLLGIDIADKLVNTTGWIIIGIREADSSDSIPGG